MPRIIMASISPEGGIVSGSNGVPVRDSDTPVSGKLPFAGRTLRDALSDIGRRYRMSKPSCADTWVVGSRKDISVLEKYETSHSTVVIGDASDGEMEYNIIPNEYTYPKELTELVENAIGKIRDSYRKEGGKFNSLSVRESAEAFFRENKKIIDDVVSEKIPFERSLKELCDVVVRYTAGTGIFELLLEDPRLEDIYIDAPCESNRIHVTLNNVSGYNSHVRCRTNLIAGEKEIRNLLNILMKESGLPFCESSPVLETNMSDGLARATVVGYPMSPNGNSVAIRKHSTTPWTLTRLLGNGTIDEYTAGLLSFLVDNRCTFLVCGARGAGKSSMLSAMMFEFPVSQRILTIEDTLELPGERMRSLGYKVQSMLIDERMDGDVGKRADEALRVSLRLGESAIVLGEVRGEEARTLYQSMRTGRAGSSIMGTIHGDSAKTVYDRVVHDIGISPESFMATDFLITMGTQRERGTNRQIRKVSEFAATADIPGDFIDAETSLFSSPAMRRIMASTMMTEDEIKQEIMTRGKIRGFLSRLAETEGGYDGPEWIILANDHVSKCISSGMTDTDSIVESFRKRLGKSDIQ